MFKKSLLCVILLTLSICVFADAVVVEEVIEPLVVDEVEEAPVVEELVEPQPIVVEEAVEVFQEEPLEILPLNSLYSWIVPFRTSNLFIGGGTVNGHLFELDVTLDPTVAYHGALSLIGQFVSQGMKSSYTIGARGDVFANDQQVKPDLALDFLYTQYLNDSASLPVFFLVGADVDYRNTVPYAGGWTFTVDAVPSVGVGIGRVYDITPLILAKLMLEQLGIPVTHENLRNTGMVLSRRDQYFSKLSSSHSDNFIRYYTDLLEALGTEASYLDVQALSLSQRYIFERSKYDHARYGGLKNGWELSITGKPYLRLEQLTPANPAFIWNTVDGTIKGEYASFLLDELLYGQIETNHTVSYGFGASTSLDYSGNVSAQLRVFPKNSSLWIESGVEVMFGTGMNVEMAMRGKANYLIAPNTSVYAQLEVMNLFRNYALHVGGLMRLL